MLRRSHAVGAFRVGEEFVELEFLELLHDGRGEVVDGSQSTGLLGQFVQHLLAPLGIGGDIELGHFALGRTGGRRSRRH